MTAEALPARRFRRAGPLDRVLSVRLAINVEVALYLLIFATAFAFRFWDLGGRALHHDESIHAQWSWSLLQGNYKHSPIFHGPFYYHVEALVFLIFGANDYTARLSAAIFGMGIVALPLLLRRWLGQVGTLTAVALIALSPTLVYYSRFFREDVFMAFFVLLMVVSMWRFMTEGRERWLIVFGAAWTGAMLTKEGTFLTVAVFLLFLDIYVAAELARATLRARGTESRLNLAILTGALALIAVPVVALWPFLGRLRRYMEWPELPRSADVLILLGTFTLPLLTPMLRYPLERFGIVATDIPGRGGELTSRLNWEFHLQSDVSVNDGIALAGLFAVTVSAAAFVGLQWRPKLWGLLFLGCVFVYLTLMTSFWTNADGLVSGPWGSLDYWREQQHEYRANEPWFYYFMVMPMYEFLPLLICVGGLWLSVVRGNVFSRFLVFWLVGQWLALSYGGEKMPWLTIHLTVPACILAAWTVNRAWQLWRPTPDMPRVVQSLLSVAGLAAGAVILLVFLPDTAVGNVIRIVVGVAAIAFTAYAIRPFGRTAVPATLAVVAIAGFGFFTVRTMYEATFIQADVPQGMLMQVHSSQEILEIMADIDALAEATGKGYYLPILVDRSEAFDWPWAWYLRDYKCVAYPVLSSANITTSDCQGVQQPYQVVLVAQSNVGRLADQLTSPPGGIQYGAGRPYVHRWWFPLGYMDAMAVHGNQSCTASSGDCGPYQLATWGRILDGFLHDGWPSTWFTYWRDHDADEIFPVTNPGRACGSCGSVDAVAYFPANFDMATGKLSPTALATPKPSTDSAGNPVFGGPGPLPGQFFAPTDIETDAAGNLYVIDSQTKRVQKFDPSGNLLASADVRTDPKDVGDYAEPWGIAVAPDGRVVVADTFGWRIRVLDSNLKPLLRFGDPYLATGVKPPGPFDLFGPRDVAVDSAGVMWVTDTGSARIVQYTLDGAFVKEIGTKGSGTNQFKEPVGLAIAADGTVFVADMGNSRVVMLDATGAWKGSFPVAGWGGSAVSDKPYLRPLADGRLAVGLPLANQVRIYDRNGTLAGTITGGLEPLTRPYGMAETAGGKLWVVEGGSSRVRLFAIP